MEKISVAVRFRPPKSSADADADSSSFSGGGSGGNREWCVGDSRISLLHRAVPVPGTSFAFDHVFTETVTNARIYGILVHSLIRAAVNGFNGTVFAYGQTSSGKTFTMNGSGGDPGIIPLAVRDIFDTTAEVADRKFLIRVSYMEIYNEEINDLLTLGSEKLPIHESLERGVYVSGLREEIVNNAEQVLQLLELGEANRHFGETNMNVRSSRSHTIFRMVIESSAKDQMNSGDAIRVSILNLVDLAGSERIAKTGADGVRLKEGKHINKSLMILGNVINKLSENEKQRGHIPYRDSKLTRILQSALGGNAKTSIICTAAPEEIHIEETRGTLQFASRAKCVSNCAQVNEILTDAALLKRQKLEIKELRKKMQGSHSEVLEQLILKQQNDMHKSQLEHDRLAMELEEERRLRKTLEHRLAEQKMSQNHNNADISAEQLADSSQLHTLKTPDSNRTPAGFVASRSRNLKNVEFSPIPENLGSVADEDLWMQLNKGCITDLDMLEMTSDFECLLSPEDTTAVVQLEEPIDDKLETVCSSDGQQLEDSTARCTKLEKELELLKEENSYLRQELLESKHGTDHLISEKEELLKELETERYKMGELKQDVRLFSQAFSLRQVQLTSLYTKSKAIVENCKASRVALP